MRGTELSGEAGGSDKCVCVCIYIYTCVCIFARIQCIQDFGVVSSSGQRLHTLEIQRERGKKRERV